MRWGWGLVVATLLPLSAGAVATRPPGAEASRHHEITNPDWIEKPDGDTFAQFYPPLALMLNMSGRAVITCAIAADGRLIDCKVNTEFPVGQGFGEAALSMAPYFKMRPQLKDGEPVGGASVTIPIAFTTADPVSRGARQAFPPGEGAQIVSPIVWLERPTPEQVAAAHPAAPTAGLASLRCRIAADGRLDACQIGSDLPTGSGFGQAAVGLVKFFRSATLTVDGRLTAGALVVVNVPFSPPPAPAPVSKPLAAPER